MHNEEGSIEKALNGEYEFTISEVFSEAWERVSGSKLHFVAAVFIYIVIAYAISMAVSLFFTPSHVYYDSGLMLKGFMNDQVQSLLMSPVLVPLMVGMLFLGIRRAGSESVNAKSIFDYYIHVWPLVFAALSMNILTLLGLLIFVLPGIYLATAYMFTLPLLIDKGLGIWQAMELSRRAVTQHWFRFFFYNVSIGIIVFISALPLGIGLIWTIPLAFIGYGILYRRVFGYSMTETERDETQISE